MLVSIALTVATVCTARACTKRLNETQWPETNMGRDRDILLRDRDPRRIGPRSRRWGFCPRRDETL